MSEALIIIPTYNERENLKSLCDQVLTALPSADLLIVDDNSPDGTGQLADELAAQNPRIQVLHRSGKLGLGTAYIAGFRYALSKHYEFVFEMDADFSHDPVYLPALLGAAKDGAGVVIGSRRVPGGGTENWGLSRQLISAGAACTPEPSWGSMCAT
jgi:dolichol-phosphate mannosyltransferase